jgi:hypothetical protein
MIILTKFRVPRVAQDLSKHLCAKAKVSRDFILGK